MRTSIKLSACVAGVAAVGILDYATGYELRVYPLYFVPVAIASAVAGQLAGLGLAALSAAAWWASNAAAGLHGSAPWVVPANAAVHLAGFTAVSYLAHRQRQRILHERDVSRRDPLTGLPNARALRERAADELADLTRTGRPLAVAFIDLDRFKEVNDVHGHAVGDDALREVARSLSEAVRDTDCAARLGGDEFVVLLPGLEADQAATALERVLTHVRAAMTARGWPITASIGAVVFERAPAHVDDLLARADAAMYRLKQAGGDRVQVAVADVG
jgi:diguanylate cyclase (GGDEF)-like protein